MPPTVKINEHRIQEVLSAASPQALQKLMQQWTDVLNKIKKKKIQVHAWLIDGVPVAVGPNEVIISFKSAIHRETTEKPQHREIIEEVLESSYGQHLAMLTLMENQWDEMVSKRKQDQPEIESDAEQKPDADPFVDEALKLVGEELLQIKD